MLYSHINELELFKAPVLRVYLAEILTNLSVQLDLSNLSVEFDLFNDNRMISLEPYVFKQLINLKVLSLAFNKLKSLDANCLKGLKRLESLNVIFNKLTRIESNTFEDFSRLERLYRKTHLL